jgi:cytochrome c oxidase subunit 3
MEQVITTHIRPEARAEANRERLKLGMWLFLGSEVMFFSGLIIAYLVLRFRSPDWPVPSEILDVPITALNTFFLIVSSYTVARSLEAIRRGDVERLQAGLAQTLILGITFLSIQAYEYNHLITVEGLSLNSSLFGATFFTLTGFHGFHVLIGVLVLLWVLSKAMRGEFSKENWIGIEIFGLYWHFVDLVWIILFTIVYLI